MSIFAVAESQTTTRYTERRSRFMGRAWVIPDPETAASHLETMRQDCPGASHYVFAWRTAPSQEFSSDAKEPGGSAGAPVLQAIKSRGLSYTLVVVARYFGGIKLGVPGLIHAYRHVAELTIDAARQGRGQWLTPIALTAPYSETSQLQAVLRQQGWNFSVEYEVHGGAYTLRVPQTEVPAARKLLTAWQTHLTVRSPIFDVVWEHDA